MPDGFWSRQELPAPPSFQCWVGLFQGPPHYALAVGRGSSCGPAQLRRHDQEPVILVRRRLVRRSPRRRADAFRAVRAVAPTGITQPSGPPPARQITTLPSRGGQCSRWPSRTQSGGMRTCTSPPSSTLLASSWRPQPLKMVLHNLLWSAALPELPRGKGPGIACVAYASNHGSPRNLWTSLFLTVRKFCDEFNTTAGCPRSECFGVP